MKRLFCAVLTAALAVGLCASPATAAKKYPTKPINVLCVYGPGGAADLALRVVAEYATKNGFTMNVVNKPGGGGSQASIEVLKSRPDGHTVLFTSTGLITLPLLKNVGYKPSDFQPVADITDMPLTFCVRSDSGIKTFPEWIAQAKDNPGQFNYGSPGSITAQRLFMSTLIRDKFSGYEVPHVPYTSGHEANTALLGNHIKAAFGVPGTNQNYLRSGDFALLAVTSPERLPEYPDAPTFKELYGDKYVWFSFHGLFVNKRTPKEVVDALSGIVGAALKDPEVIDKFQKIGVTANYRTPEEFQQTVTRYEAFITEAMEGLNL